MVEPAPDATSNDGTRSHLRFGWWSLLVFLTLGSLLEAMHGFKIGWYLDVTNDTRRLMFRLAHAHGTLLSLVHIALGLTLAHAPHWRGASRVAASRCLAAGSILMPLGFLFGGLVTHAGDPGLGVLLVPPGAVLLFIAVLLTARGMAAAAPTR